MEQTKEFWAKDALLDYLAPIQRQQQEKPTLFYQSALENLKQEFEDLGLPQKLWWKVTHPALPYEELIHDYIQEGKTDLSSPLPFKGWVDFRQNLQRARQTWLEIQRRQQMLDTWIGELKKSSEETVDIPHDIEIWLNPKPQH